MNQFLERFQGNIVRASSPTDASQDYFGQALAERLHHRILIAAAVRVPLACHCSQILTCRS